MEQNLQQILQQQLRDVHLPEPISWWPLAFGWWVLIVLAVLAIAGLVFLIIRNKRQNRYRKDALAELRECYAHWQTEQKNDAYLQSVNAVLKRSVQHIDGASYLLRLSGDDWVNALDQYVKQPLSAQTKDALSVKCYQANADIDVADVQANITKWLKSHNRSFKHSNTELGGQHA